MSIHVTAYMTYLGSHWTYFHGILVDAFSKSVERIPRI